jgi:predicted Zn-dependent protease
MRSDFDVAKIVYGLVSTGVVELANLERTANAAMAAAEDVAAQLRRGTVALEAGHLEEALSCARRVIAGDSRDVAARVLAARALTGLNRHADAVDELKRAVQADPFDPAVHLALGFAAARSGELKAAIVSWSQFLTARPTGTDSDRVRAALDAATRLNGVLEEVPHG